MSTKKGSAMTEFIIIKKWPERGEVGLHAAISIEALARLISSNVWGKLKADALANALESAGGEGSASELIQILAERELTLDEGMTFAQSMALYDQDIGKALLAVYELMISQEEDVRVRTAIKSVRTTFRRMFIMCGPLGQARLDEIKTWDMEKQFGEGTNNDGTQTHEANNDR